MKQYEDQFKKLTDVGSISRGKSKHRPRNAPELYGGPYPFVQTGDVKAANFFITDFTQTYSERGLAQSRLWQPGTLLITIAANIADTAILKIAACFPDSIIGFIPRKDESDVRFVKYCLDTYKTQMQSISQGTTQDNLSQGKLLSLRFRIPDYSKQRKIAAILSAYDELVENNERRGALLERMAEDIYREWFIRYRFPGYERVQVIKGVPEGWKVKKFREIVEYYIGGGWGEDDQSASFSEPAFVVRGTDIPDLQAGRLNVCPYRFHKPSNLKSRTLRPYDFVFEVSGGSKDQLLGRNVMITERVWTYFKVPIIAASFCKQIRFSSLVSPYFMKYFMKLYYDYDLVGIYQVQSTGISNYQFESFLKFQTIIIPPRALQKQFEDEVRPIVEMQDQIALANIALRKTRDALLPRLISGKLSLDNLDIQFPPSMAEVLNAEPTPTAHA
jgi:type I restriction enzyme S subunit